jgi:predicted secreted protein
MGPVHWAARSLLLTILAVLVLASLGIYVGVLLKLTVSGAFGLYFVVWWTLVFAILPIRVQTQAEVGEIAEGTEPGAPANPALRERAIWTTIAADVVFAAIAALFPLSGL